MTCEELLKSLNEYIDDEASLAFCQEFAEQLAGCNPCQVVMDNIRKTIALYKSGQPYPMPPEFEARLRSSLQERWEQKFGKVD